MRTLATLGALAALVMIVASACGGGEGADAPPTGPSEQGTAALTPTTTRSGGTPASPAGLAAEISTPAGTFVIKEVQRGDRIGQRVAESGYHILVVSLKPKDVSETSGEPFEPQLDAWTDEIYVSDIDGARAVVDVWTLELGGAPPGFGPGDEPGIEYVTLVQLVFAPSATAQGLKLYSPGNPPIDLGE